MARLVTLDAGVLIALHSQTDQHHNWAVELFTELVDFEWQISTLTYAEVQVHPIRAGVLENFQLSLGNLNIIARGMMPEDATGLAQIRATTGAKMPDAVVIHQAKILNSAIATTDRGLAHAALKLGIDVYQPGSRLG
jgi:predicted nucleic acid-binding protein